MTRTSTSQIKVAVAGLGILPETRLKVACSLLMAERLDVGVVAWGAPGVDMLVADTTSSEGSHALASARKQQLPLLAMTRAQSTVIDPTTTLSSAASVREITNALRRLISTSVQGRDKSERMVPPLLEHLQLGRQGDGLMLMELSLLRIVVDVRGGEVHMLRRMPWDDLIQNALSTSWRITELSENDWQQNYQPDVVDTRSIEALWWQLAALSEKELPAATNGTFQLSMWPDLDASVADPRWLPVLAYLMDRRWNAADLAVATGADISLVQRLMYVISASGLAADAQQQRSLGTVSATAITLTSSFLKVAKRFGLKLFGPRHG